MRRTSSCNRRRATSPNFSAPSNNALDCANSTRWMDGTCLEAPEQPMGDDETFAFTFHPDVAANPQVVEALLT